MISPTIYTFFPRPSNNRNPTLLPLPPHIHTPRDSCHRMVSTSLICSHDRCRHTCQCHRLSCGRTIVVIVAAVAAVCVAQQHHRKRRAGDEIRIVAVADGHPADTAAPVRQESRPEAARPANGRLLPCDGAVAGQHQRGIDGNSIF